VGGCAATTHLGKAYKALGTCFIIDQNTPIGFSKTNTTWLYLKQHEGYIVSRGCCSGSGHQCASELVSAVSVSIVSAEEIALTLKQVVGLAFQEVQAVFPERTAPRSTTVCISQDSV
jgi:hypothetical protein